MDGAPGTIGVGGMLRRATAAWRPYRRLAAGLLLVLLVQQAFTTGLALSLKHIVDGLLAADGRTPLALIIGALAIGYGLAAGATLFGEYLSAIATGRITNDARRRVFAHLQQLSLDYFARTPLGEVLGRFAADMEVLRQGLARRMVSGALACIGLLVNLPVLFYLEWRLAALTIVTVPLMAWVVGRLTPAAAEATYALQQSEAQLLDAVQENVRAQQVLKAFGLTERAEQRFDEQLAALARTSVRSGFLISLVGSGATLGVHFVQLLITGAGAWMADAGALSAGALVAFLSLLQVVSKDTIELTKRVVPTLVTASGGVRRIEELLAEPVGVSEPPDATDAPALADSLTLDHVTFSYDGTRPTLRDLSLRVPAGKYVAFVGPSGSGKSTVLNLIMRFYEPTEGAVTVDGRDLRRTTLASLRQQMGVVFQDTFLFNRSIRENIRLARPDATDAEVEAAARAAEIHDLVASLPMGYDTPAGEGGARLSGGQRQRVAIARAMLRDPRVLLLDEATSALDPATEAAVNDTVARLADGRTVISVTHRLASVVGADCIFVLDGGQLAEAGTHAELLARGGLYYHMWEKQAGFEISRDGRHATIDVERLRRIPLFAPLTDRQLAALSGQFTSDVFEPDEVVFRAGEPGDRFYVVVRGKVEVRGRGPDGQPVVLACLEDGDVFGELALLDDAPRNATIRALTPTLTISLDREQFHALLAGSEDVLREVRAVASARRHVN